VLQLLADNGTSIKDIYHNRSLPDTDISSVRVTCVVETADLENAHKMFASLAAHGYEVDMPSFSSVPKTRRDALGAVLTGRPRGKEDAASDAPVE